MKNFTLLMTFLMMYLSMVKSQSAVTGPESLNFSPKKATGFYELDFVWCDFEGEYSNVDGFRERINNNAVVRDVAGFGVDGSTVVEVNYTLTTEIPYTGYQMWTYPNMIDVSQFQFMAFNVMADMTIDSAYVILRDNVSNEDGNSQHAFNIDTEWKQVILPLDSFKVQTGWTTPADLTILHLIQIMFLKDIASEDAAIVYLDDVGFITDTANVSSIGSDLKAVNVYPNPATGYVNVSAADGSQIDIINLHGSILASKISDGKTTPFSLSGMPAGVYYIRVTSSDKNQIIRKLIAR